MLDLIKKAGKEMFGGGRDEIDRILDLPITKLRIELKNYYTEQEYTEASFEDFTQRLTAAASKGTPRDVAAFERQVELTRTAIEKFEVDSAVDIELDTPEKQLLWASALTRMMMVGDKPVVQERIWDQLQDSIGVFNEKIRVSAALSKSMQNDSVSFVFGQPGSWFYFDPRGNNINLDLYMTLIMGFEHGRAIDMHEIGHSELSLDFSPRMQEIYDKAKRFIDPRTIEDKNAPPPKMTRAEQKEMALLVKEWELRFHLWHMVEDNAVDQFTANMSKLLPQDYGYSMNHAAVVMRGYGELVMGDALKNEVKISSDKPYKALLKKKKQLKEYKEKLEEAEKKMAAEIAANPVVTDPDEAEAIRQAQQYIEQQKKAVESMQKQLDEAKKNFQEKMERISRPLTDKEVQDIKAGNISIGIADKVQEEICSLVLLAFYDRNGLFRPNEKAWERFYVFASDMNRLFDVSDIPEAKGMTPFEYLVHVAGGASRQDRELMQLPLNEEGIARHVIACSSKYGDDVENLCRNLDADQRKKLVEEIVRDEKLFSQVDFSSGDITGSLLKAAVFERGMRNLQPDISDRHLGRDHYRAAVKAGNTWRASQMEHVWDRFVKPFADVLMKEYEKQVDQRLDQQQQQQQQKNNQGQSSQQQSGGNGGGSGGQGSSQQQQSNSQGGGQGSSQSQSQSQSGGQSQDQNGGSSGQQGPTQQQQEQNGGNGAQDQSGQNAGKDKQKDASGGKGGKDPSKDKGNSDPSQQSGQGGGSDEKMDVDDQLLDDMKKMAETPKEQREKENAENAPQNDNGEGDQNPDSGQGNQQGADQGNDQGDNKGTGEGSDGQGNESQGNEGQGNEGQNGQDQGSPGDKPGNESGKSGGSPSKNGGKPEKSGGRGWGQDKDYKGNPERVGDVRQRSQIDENMTEEQKKALREAAGNMPKGKSMKTDPGGNQRSVDLAKLAKGDWKDYSARVRELMPVINQMTASFRRIRAEQQQEIMKQSDEHELMPRDGDFRKRLDRDKFLETKWKQASGQPLELKDLEKFRKDKSVLLESTIEITSMIDGSGSMPALDLGGGVSAMDVAIQSAVIVYEAARRAGIDSYIVIWGDPQPLVVATPKSTPKEVGQALDRFKRGTGSGTQLAPGLVATVGAQAEHKNDNGTISGSSHILIFSDGEIQDKEETIKKLGVIAREGENVSVDVAVLRPKIDRLSDFGRSYVYTDKGLTHMEDAFDQTIKDVPRGAKKLSYLRGNDPRELPLQLARMMLSRVRSFKVTTRPDSEKRKMLKKIHKKLEND